MVLLGMNRVVVKDGTIGARLRFRAAAADHTKRRLRRFRRSGTGTGVTEWGVRGSRSYAAPRTKVSTVGVNVQTDSELKAELFGEVKINFASETVPLDRFVDDAKRTLLERHARQPRPAAPGRLRRRSCSSRPARRDPASARRPAAGAAPGTAAPRRPPRQESPDEQPATARRHAGRRRRSERSTRRGRQASVVRRIEVTLPIEWRCVAGPIGRRAGRCAANLVDTTTVRLDPVAARGASGMSRSARMTTDEHALPLEHFIQAVQSQLDNAQTAMALKARNLNLPLTFAIKDITLDLRAHVEFAPLGDPHPPGRRRRQGSERLPPGVHRDHPADDRGERDRLPGRSEDAIADDDLSDDERKQLEWSGVRTRGQLRELTSRAASAPSNASPGCRSNACAAPWRAPRPRWSPTSSPADRVDADDESRRASAAARSQPPAERPAARHDWRRAGQRALGSDAKSSSRRRSINCRRTAPSTAPDLAVSTASISGPVGGPDPGTPGGDAS